MICHSTKLVIADGNRNGDGNDNGNANADGDDVESHLFFVHRDREG